MIVRGAELHHCWMGNRWLLGAALLGACGSTGEQPVDAAGGGAGEVAYERDAGSDAGRDAGSSRAEAGGSGGETQPSAAGESGQAAPNDEAGSGGAGMGGGGRPAVGGTGGQPAAVGGAGTGGSGGNPAPTEHVLWSQAWTVAIHDASANNGYKVATMGLLLDAGDLCRFGEEGAASGSSQTYPTDGKCITAFQLPVVGSAVIYDQDGMNPHGGGGRTELVGWKAAVLGHKVTGLRRTQSYSIHLNGTGTTSYNYADFTGIWEALGF